MESHFVNADTGDTLTQIAWRMDEEEWPTVKGGTWHPQTIRNILSNRFYVEANNPIITDEVFAKATDRLAHLKSEPQ